MTCAGRRRATGDRCRDPDDRARPARDGPAAAGERAAETGGPREAFPVYQPRSPTHRRDA